MSPVILVDAGPLIALLDRQDLHHTWAVEQFKAFPPPFLTCEAAITEASHILHRNGFDADLVFELITPGAVTMPFDLEQESVPVRALLERYRDVPMDLADACLVRMSELHGESRVMTVDTDFYVYRRHRREAIPVIAPPSAPR